VQAGGQPRYPAVLESGAGRHMTSARRSSPRPTSPKPRTGGIRQEGLSAPRQGPGGRSGFRECRLRAHSRLRPRGNALSQAGVPFHDGTPERAAFIDADAPLVAVESFRATAAVG